MAANNGDDRGFDDKTEFSSIFTNKPLRTELLVDSKALLETLTTLLSSHDYRLWATVARMSASFESHELNAIRWIRGVRNLADALTKRNFIL